MPKYNKSSDVSSYDELLTSYASFVKTGLMSCEISPGLMKLKEKTKYSKWMVVSGGDQVELNDLFRDRMIFSLFELGIFGSPDSKDEILNRELKNRKKCEKILFIGDSKYDYDASFRAEIDFLFVSDWTELLDWRLFVDKNKIQSVKNLSCLL